MKTKTLLILLISLIIFSNIGQAQEIREYIVKKTSSTIEIDGLLNEPDWVNAGLTEKFVIYNTGAETRLSTQAKLLWDDTNLYISFTSEDPDVWGEMVNHDSHLWNEEVVEVFCDPDGDGLQYLELQANPLGTKLDLVMSKAYSAGGSADFSWQLEDFKVGIGIKGTQNDLTDVDTLWICEMALPFQHLAFCAPTKNFPPLDGDQWRLLMTRYDYERTGSKRVEISAWNKLDNRGFHAPDKFGRIIFSNETVSSVKSTTGSKNHPVTFELVDNFPNPFDTSTTIKYKLVSSENVKIEIYNSLGQKIKMLRSDLAQTGIHSIEWDGRNESGKAVAAGSYIVRMSDGKSVSTRTILKIR